MSNWKGIAQGVQISTASVAKSLIDLHNGAAGYTIKVGRVTALYAQIVLGSSALPSININRYVGIPVLAATGYSFSPIPVISPVDPSDPNLPNLVTLGITRDTGSSKTLLRSLVFAQTNGPGNGTNTISDWEAYAPLAEVWNSGYKDSNVQKLTLRENQGFEIYHASGTATTGTGWDFEIEFEVV